MKFTVNRKIMLEYLKSMIKVVPKSSPMQELKGFLVEANEEDGFLYVTATNKGVAIQRKFKPQLETGGGFVMDARLLTDILSVLGENEVTFEDKGHGTIEIISGSCTYTMKVLETKKYPKPEIPFPDTTISVSNMSRLYGKTSASVAKNGVSEVLKGVHFDINQDKMRVISCNDKNIAHVIQKIPNNGNMKFTLPKDVFYYLASAVGDDEIELGLCGNSIVFMKEGLLFSARRLEKEFVNVDRVFDNLETAYAAKVEFDELKEQVINICDIASLGSKTSYIKAVFSDDKIELSTQNDMGLGTNTVSVVKVAGASGQTYYYNASTLRDVFKTVEGPLIMRLDIRGYLDVMNYESQYLMMPTPEENVNKQLESFAEEDKPKKRRKNESTEKQSEPKAA